MKKMNKKGMGTVEVVIIIAVLVTLALIFRQALISYGQKVMTYCFDENKVIGSL